MALMKTPVDLSKDIDEWPSIVLIFSLREEMKAASGAGRCCWKRRLSWEQGWSQPAWPCLQGCTFSCFCLAFLRFFLVLSETGNEGWTVHRNSRPVFNIQIIKSPPINPLLLIILKGLTIRRQYSAIDSHSRRMPTSPPVPARASFWGCPPPLLCSFVRVVLLLPSPCPRAQAAPR